MELTSLQKSTVMDILDLYNPEEKAICEFKAPTGSGKTLMATYLISSIMERNQNDKFVFVIATPSSSSLPYFFEQKINKYKKDLPFSKFDVEYIQSPSTAKSDKSEALPKIISESNKVYIFGKSSFGKGRILSEYGIIDDFVKATIDKKYKLIYIRDEAHIGGESLDKGTLAQNFEKMMSEAASFVLKMTATPDFRNQNTKKIILTENELKNPVLNEGKYLLKTNPVVLVNKDLKNDDILDNAIEKFKEIKQKYQDLNIGIKPAMLIQVDNDSTKDAVKSREFKEALEKVKKKLQGANFAWVQYFGNNDKDSNRNYKNDFSLDDITANNNDIDAIIFKIGPATGWDIPRACMLLQLRKVSSSNLNIQTLGRIKRNPYPNLEKNDVTDNYYIYSNVDNDDNSAVMYNFKVRSKFECENFLSIDIINKKDLITAKPQPEFFKLLNEFLSDKKQLICQEINNTFVENKTIYRKVLSVVNEHQIYTDISNPFIFLRDYNRFINANKKLYNLIKSNVESFAKEIDISKEFVFTVLLNTFKADILNIVSKTKTYVPKYKIVEQVYDPRSYTQIFNDSPEQEERVSKRDYLFDIFNEDEQRNNRQPLDSTPERIVYNQIYDFAEDTDSIKLWAKNQTSSNIFGEYLDDDNNIRHSYFDFIIKFKNGFYLYIEVKSKNDINAEKTKQLEKAYQDYFENTEKDLFAPKLAISVWKVDNSTSKILTDTFYDKHTIKENLAEMPIKTLLDKLSKLEIA